MDSGHFLSSSYEKRAGLCSSSIAFCLPIVWLVKCMQIVGGSVWLEYHNNKSSNREDTETYLTGLNSLSMGEEEVVGV